MPKTSYSEALNEEECRTSAGANAEQQCSSGLSMKADGSDVNVVDETILRLKFDDSRPETEISITCIEPGPIAVTLSILRNGIEVPVSSKKVSALAGTSAKVRLPISHCNLSELKLFYCTLHAVLIDLGSERFRPSTSTSAKEEQRALI